MIEWSWCNIVIMLTFLQYCAWKCSYCSIVCMNITLHILPEVKNWNYLVPQYQQLCLLSNSAAGVILCPFTLKRTSHIPHLSHIHSPVLSLWPLPSLPTHCNSCITYASLFIPPSPTFPITYLYILQNSVLSQFSMGSLRNTLTFQLLAYLKKEEEKKHSPWQSGKDTHTHTCTQTHMHIHAHTQLLFRPSVLLICTQTLKVSAYIQFTYMHMHTHTHTQTHTSHKKITVHTLHKWIVHYFRMWICGRFQDKLFRQKKRIVKRKVMYKTMIVESSKAKEVSSLFLSMRRGHHIIHLEMFLEMDNIFFSPLEHFVSQTIHWKCATNYW